MRRPGQILVVSGYELGHQPLAAASLMAFLERAGFRPRAVDLSVEGVEALETAAGPRPRLVLISVPMHTALSIGVRAGGRLRHGGSTAHRCFFGHYALLNADYLLDDVADSVAGGEAEATLVELAQALEQGRPLAGIGGLGLRGRPGAPRLERLDFPVPSRDGLPPLERYATLVHRGAHRTAAAIETSRGCLHHCRHCPLPAVYAGRFFVVPRHVVLEDVRNLVAAGVRHLSFADPDFFNGPGHAMRIVREMHREYPELTFDITTKVEHVLKHRRHFDELAACGCLFVVSAVESLSDRVLAELDKGHTRPDVQEALQVLRNAGIAMRPTWVAFTPWTTLEDYREMLDWIAGESLIHHIDPVQLSIRLLIPPGSLLVEHAATRAHLGSLSAERFCYDWTHPDPRMDLLHREVSRVVREAAQRNEDEAATYARIRELAWSVSEDPAPPPTRFLPALAEAPPPRLTEPWFC